MNNPFYFIAVLTAFNLPAQSQVLGIFEQGAAELKEYDQQIAALELLLTRQQEGYRVVESGLTAISAITGTEYNLHQHYFTSLDAVNPAIAQSSDIASCLSLESAALTTLSSALQRWRSSKYLTAGELAYINQMTNILTNAASAQLNCILLLLTSDSLTMTDNERLQQINTVGRQLASIITFCSAFIYSTDTLILDRTY